MSEKTNGHETPAKSGQAAEAAASAGNAGSPEAQVSDAPDAVEPKAAPSKALQARAGVDPALATRIEDMPLMAQAEYFRTRIDPTRGRRIVEAMKLLKPITYDSENQHNHYKYASAAKVYAVVQNALAQAGLYVRKKLNSMEITEVDLPGCEKPSGEHQERAHRAAGRLVRFRRTRRRPGSHSGRGNGACTGARCGTSSPSRPSGPTISGTG